MEAGRTVLEVRGLKTWFPLRSGLLKAVDDVDFTLERGRTLCVVGESGSGKSVTARSILQIVDSPGRIEAGEILLHRHLTAKGGGGEDETIDLAKLKPRSAAMRAIRGRDIGMIFQEPMSSLSPVHRIGDQIGEVIRLHERASKREARSRAVELLRRVEIPEPERAVDRYPFELSGGMRQRAMIAMALSCNPSILIADEPTTALDVTTQAEILDLIEELQESFGMAVMFITHDMGVVAEIADEVVVMRYGKLVERGPAAEIFRTPRHAYTQQLLAAVLELERPAPQRQARTAPPSRPPIVEMRGLGKLFESRRGFLGRHRHLVHAVDGVDLVLHEGENLGIVGESGSGKTTLGRCLMRVLEPSAGEIRYRRPDGSTIDLAKAAAAQVRQAHREMRMIFQDPFASLNPRMTVAQIVGEPLLVNGIAGGAALRERVAGLLETVGLPRQSMERYPHAFSGGQRQRIGVARAIALEPRVIVADEATSALDVSLRTQVLDLLLELQDRLGLSFIFISHDISVIRYFCDRVAVMYRGRIVETGDALEVCDNPRHPYTKALLSAVPHPDPARRRIHERHRYREPA